MFLNAKLATQIAQDELKRRGQKTTGGQSAAAAAEARRKGRSIPKSSRKGGSSTAGSNSTISTKSKQTSRMKKPDEMSITISNDTVSMTLQDEDELTESSFHCHSTATASDVGAGLLTEQDEQKSTTDQSISTIQSRNSNRRTTTLSVARASSRANIVPTLCSKSGTRWASSQLSKTLEIVR
uniref:Uncharacterized protein n=1 Tax=Entomoneis paludosa TaxID=265537 RepID=A0A7S2VA91_9STRA|mmetsp:Transcript_10355/g.21289  ORF Transcript_10355/g.21289 Transcript_10355/m.21289 type:complete len:182 (+) Transcript_10355:177-722(+)